MGDAFKELREPTTYQVLSGVLPSPNSFRGIYAIIAQTRMQLTAQNERQSATILATAKDFKLFILGNLFEFRRKGQVGLAGAAQSKH
jgi:hypothetical protein